MFGISKIRIRLFSLRVSLREMFPPQGFSACSGYPFVFPLEDVCNFTNRLRQLPLGVSLRTVFNFSNSPPPTVSPGVGKQKGKTAGGGDFLVWQSREIQLPDKAVKNIFEEAPHEKAKFLVGARWNGVLVARCFCF